MKQPSYSDLLYLEIMKLQVMYPDMGMAMFDREHCGYSRSMAFLELVKEYTLPMVDDVYRSVMFPSVTMVDYPGSQELSMSQGVRIFERVLKDRYLRVYNLILKYPLVKRLYPEELRKAVHEIHASQK